jgi:uncharacterized membrane protein
LQTRTLFIARLAAILALTFVIQMAGLPQPITGPLINAMLFITAILLGNFAGVVLGCLTPVLAIIHGQLPTPLAPMIPFIALGNVTLVLIYNNLAREKSQISFSIKEFVAILLAAFAKFLFIYLSIKIILPFLLNVTIPEKISMLMATPQLLTALAGGILALIFTKILTKAES